MRSRALFAGIGVLLAAFAADVLAAAEVRGVRLWRAPDNTRLVFDLTGPVNLGNPTEYTVRQLAELVIEFTGSRSEIVDRPRPADDPVRRRPDIAQAGERLGWQPRIGIAEGLRQTIRYFEKVLRRSVPA